MDGPPPAISHLPRSIRVFRSTRLGNGASVDKGRLRRQTQGKREYETRKVAGLCAQRGCKDTSSPGRSKCHTHLGEMSGRARKRYGLLNQKGLCVCCGARPQFWGVRCVVCRQIFSEDPLPAGARRALRRYRKAEKERDAEDIELQTRIVVRALLESGQVTGPKVAEALRLYAGLDSGQWRTYSEVAKIMKLSKQRVGKLLLPIKNTLSFRLCERVPWKRAHDIH